MSRSLTDLVYLINEDDRVFNLSSLERFDNFTWNCTNICSSMTLECAGISGASKSNSDVFTAERLGNGFTD